jgi:hypothetical protein
MTPPPPSSMPDTLPTAFDPAGFVGEIAADGQRVRVAALATDPTGQVALLSIVGYETSISAVLARLVRGEQLGFLPIADWDGPTALEAMRLSYWLWRADLSGTREKQGVAFPRCASIDYSLRTPPTLPQLSPEAAKQQQEAAAADPFAETEAILDQLRTCVADPSPMPPRIVFANVGHAAPTPSAFFGHLKGLRVITLPALAWIDYLWVAGLDHGMITPLPTLGISAWRLDGDPRHWNALVSDGVRRGVLPTTRPTARDTERLGLRRSE